MTYNLTIMTDGNGFTSNIVTAANTYTNGLLTGIFLIMIFFVLLLIMKRWEFEKSVAASSYFCFVLSLMMKSAGWISMKFVLGFFVLAAITTLYLSFSGRNQV